MRFRSASKSQKPAATRLPGERARGLAARRRSRASRPNLDNLEDRCLLNFSPSVSYPVGATPQAVATPKVAKKPSRFSARHAFNHATAAMAPPSNR